MTKHPHIQGKKGFIGSQFEGLANRDGEVKGGGAEKGVSSGRREQWVSMLS